MIRNVSRIVPLNGDIAETIFTLGLSSRVVGVDTSALYPKRFVDRLPKIGYQRTLSAEGILAAADGGDRARRRPGRLRCSNSSARPA